MRAEGHDDQQNQIGDDVEFLVILYRNLVNATEAGIENERTRAFYEAAIPFWCARWTAWQGEDSLHEMAFGEPPLEPRRDTWRDWLYLFTVIGRPEFIAQFLVLISLSALILLVLHWIFGIPLGPSHPIAK